MTMDAVPVSFPDRISGRYVRMGGTTSNGVELLVISTG
jgi:hypothetical protein